MNRTKALGGPPDRTLKLEVETPDLTANLEKKELERYAPPNSLHRRQIRKDV